MRRLLSLSLCMIAVSAVAQPNILNMRERAELIDRWLDIRVQTVLPDLMRRADIDM